MVPMTVNDSIVFAYVVTDIACLCFMLPIMRKIKTTFGSEMEARLFISMVSFFVAYIVSDAGMIFFRQINTVTPLWFNYFIGMIHEAALLMVAFFWFLFANVRLKNRYIDLKWYKITISLPCILDFILIATTPFTKLIFYFDEAGFFVRGSYYMLQPVAILIYIFMTSFLATMKSFHTAIPSEKVKAVSLIKFIVPPAIASALQQISHNVPTVSLGLALAVYLVYLDMLDMQVYNDSLTGLNNRRRAKYFLLDCLETADTKPFVVYMIDVDYFKEINDKFGHSEGDRALCIVADALKATANQYAGFTARMGGDEFLIVMKYNAGVIPEHISTTVKHYIDRKCRDEKIPYQINVSIGYMICKSKEISINELLVKADEMQYKTKREHHGKSMQE